MKFKKYSIIFILIISTIFIISCNEGKLPEKGTNEYEFSSKSDGEMIDIWGMTNEDLTEHLLMCVPEAEHYVKDLGMVVLVTEEVTEFEYGEIGRDIWLGTDHKDHFVKEILYTVTNYNQIFEYDVVNDVWNLSWPL